MSASIAISIIATVTSGMVLFLLQRYIKRHEDLEKKRHEAHRQENILILKSIKANGELTQANSIAIRDGKTNGEMKKALTDYEKVAKELDEFLIEQSADN